MSLKRVLLYTTHEEKTEHEKNYKLEILFCAINESLDILLPIACNAHINKMHILYTNINYSSLKK